MIYSDSENHYWVVADLWESARGLEPFELDLRDLPELSCSWLAWIHNRDHPIIRAEMPRVLAADRAYPVILHPRGWLMDGFHRVAQALLAGERKIMAVQFALPQLPLPLEDRP